MHHRYLARLLAVSAVLVAFGLASARRDAPAASAQDLKSLAEQYISNVILNAGDVPGYRAIGSPNIDLEGAVAARAARFAPDSGGRALVSFTVWVYVYDTVEGARSQITAIGESSTVTNPDGSETTFQAGVSLTGGGVDEGNRYDYRRRNTDGSVDVGSGWGFRRGLVAYVVAGTGGTNVSTNDRNTEVGRVANLQNDKASRVGDFVIRPAAPSPTPPPATPTPTPTPSSSTPASSSGTTMPSMSLLVTARVGGALVRDNTTIRAIINGKECGRSSTVLGFTLITVSSADEVAGCGTPGAIITFTVGDDRAEQFVEWSLGNIATPAGLTASRSVGSRGLVVRPTLEANCIPAGDSCTDQERLLWAGNLDAWISELLSRGQDNPSGEALLRAWLGFRADRGEVFGNLAIAFLDKQPYTFILSVRFAPADDEPEPYVTLFTMGQDRPVDGWVIRTDGGATYTFPPGSTLTTGLCRIYASASAAAADSGGSCPGASLSGGDRPLDAHGYVEILDDQGEVVDSVAW